MSKFVGCTTKYKKKCTPAAKMSQLFSEPFASLGPLEISAQNANDVDLMLKLGKMNASRA